MLAACTCRSLAQETQPQGETGEAPSAGAPVRIGLAVPQNEDDSFWSLFVEAAEEAAADLGVELVVRCADGARERMRLQIEELCSGPDPVDAVIFQNFKMGAPGFLEAAESAGVPALMVNAGLSPEQAEQLGVPRSKLRWWVGEMLPDDEATGARLADVLIDAAAAARPPAGPGGATQPLQVIALAGVVSDGASIERAKGLARVLATRDDATLLQVIGADWDRELARVRCRVLLKRYPSASVVWAANDPMALGAVDAARDVGRRRNYRH